MKVFNTAALLALSILPAVSSAAQEDTSDEPRTYKEIYEQQQKTARKPIEFRWFVGGAVGFAFGTDVGYAEFSPILGYRISAKFQLGASFTLRYRSDKRYEPDLSTTDIGGSLFGRYFVLDPIFFQVEFERLRWEYPISNGGQVTTVRDTYDGLYAGAGFVQPMGGRTALYMSFLWDFNYDNDIPSPNSHPWIIRIGFGWTF